MPIKVYEKTRERAQLLMDQIHKETLVQSNPSSWETNKAMLELRCLPCDDLTIILIEMLWHDPIWPILSALRYLHPDDPVIPKEDHGKFHLICQHWIAWAIENNHTDES